MPAPRSATESTGPAISACRRRSPVDVGGNRARVLAARFATRKSPSLQLRAARLCQPQTRSIRRPQRFQAGGSIRTGVHRMNKNELIGAVADASGLSRSDATKAVEGVFDTITGALKKGDEVRLVGFGTFSLQAQGLDRPQPAHRRADDDQGFDPAQVQGRQGPQGYRRPLRKEVAPPFEGGGIDCAEDHAGGMVQQPIGGSRMKGLDGPEMRPRTASPTHQPCQPPTRHIKCPGPDGRAPSFAVTGRAWACSSVVEHTLHTGGVASSILATPTTPFPLFKVGGFSQYLAENFQANAAAPRCLSAKLLKIRLFPKLARFLLFPCIRRSDGAPPQKEQDDAGRTGQSFHPQRHDAGRL